MAVRLVIGRAGTGKTALCVREIRAAMAQDPLGPPLLWLTPPQATFSAERMLLTFAGAAGPAGSFRAQVLSLGRLALLVARDVGLLGGEGQAGRPMDEIARELLLEETVRQERGRLSVFAAVADRPGFIRKLDSTLRELRQHGHSGASLRALVDSAGGGMDAVMRRKLLDLAVLLDAWSAVVEKPDAWDAEYLMHQATLKMGESRLISAGTRIWVDAMSAMSTLEIRMLAGLGLQAGELTITLLADPDAPAVRDMRADPAEGGGGGLFSRTERLHRQLIDAFRRQGVPMGPAVALRQGRRFVDPAVRRVEAELLEETAGAPAESDATPSAAPLPVVPPLPPAPARGRKKRQADADLTLFDAFLPAAAGVAAAPVQRQEDPVSVPGGGVEIWESSDPETEVRMAAQAIREMVLGGGPEAGPPLRYRQIAVIVPDLDDAGSAAGSGYQDAIRRIFAEHDIPHFIDARRGIAHHPLVELLRSAVTMVTSRFDRDEMLLLLKSQLAGVSAEDVSLLENYVIEHGISHVPWDQPWTWVAPNQQEESADARLPASAFARLAQVNGIRARVWASLAGFVEQMRAPADGAPDSAGAARFPRALRGLLASLQVEGQLAAWAKTTLQMPAGAGAELAQVHQQIWREIERLLTLLETMLTGRQRTLEEFERLLASAFQSLTLGLIPPTVDQVLVSSVTRSRVPEMEVVLILGAVEGQFPKVVSEDPILSDAQREAFNAVAADPIGEGSDRQLLEMPFFDYVALTRARRRLILSRPLADRQGRALGASRHMQRLGELLGGRLVRRSFDAQSRTHIERMASADDVLSGVTSWARGLYASSGERAAAMPAVYQWLVTEAPPALAAARGRIWRCVGPRRMPALAEGLAAGFYPPDAPLRMTITELELFAACPLNYFAQYTLGLRPRAEFELDRLSLGQLQHRILERVYRRLMDGALGWPACEEQSLRELLVREVDVTVLEMHAEIAQRTPGYDKTRQRLIRVLGIMLEADRRRAMGSVLRPRAVELYFGRGDVPQTDAKGRLVSLPVLQLAGERRIVHVRGKIDRMDQTDPRNPAYDPPYAALIDYKSAARKSMDLFRVLHGIALQLPAYALVVRNLAEINPLAGLYIPLGLARQTIAHAGEAKVPGTDEFFQQFKPRGLVDAAAAHLLDGALPPPEQSRGGAFSPWYSMKFKLDGAPQQKSDLLLNDDFHLVLDFVARMIVALADALVGGTIAPAPYRCGSEIPCDHCEFSSLCPFDPARDDFREVTRMSRGEVLGQMRQRLQSGVRGDVAPADAAEANEQE